MEQKILSGVEGINIYGVVSISIFFGFFTGMLIWAFLRKQSYLTKMSALPLDGGEINSNEKTPSEKL
jgi:hypothetical protein